jgi:hypothetical protein
MIAPSGVGSFTQRKGSNKLNNIGTDFNNVEKLVLENLMKALTEK